MSIQKFKYLFYFKWIEIVKKILMRPFRYLIGKINILHQRMRGSNEGDNIYMHFAIWFFDDILLNGLLIAFVAWSIFNLKFRPIEYGIMWWFLRKILEKLK